ncbi:MAG: thermonuclease family protein [Cruoricaptor ignavus]|nr:thermonuclease family protein [Cruoricaptor ignavus]
MNSFWKKWLLVVALWFCGNIFCQTYTAKIIKVKDGDTVDILYKGKSQTIRLAHIDCPEKNQPFGKKAKQYTSDFCFGKTVKVAIAGKPDRYGRWIAEIFYNNQNLNKNLVRNGLAWHFKKYSKNDNYANLEQIARKRKIGLWQESHPIEPWNWRKYKRKQK